MLAPSGRGGSLLGVRLAAQRTLVVVVAALMGLMALSMGPLYASLGSALSQFAGSFPDTMVAALGGGDLTTPAGFLHIEVLGLMAPAAVIVVAAATASAAIAGEERAGRLSHLLAQPVSRNRVFWTATAAVAVNVTIVTGATMLGLWVGALLGRIDVSPGRIAGAGLLLLLLGWFFGVVALAVSAATGSPGATTWTVTGLAVGSYFGYTLLAAAGHESAGWWSPLRPYLYGPPIQEGVEWWQPVWLLVGIVVPLCLGPLLLARRDLRR